jgi:hypothetical protein
MGWLARSLGQFGSDAGQGYDINLGWKERLQQMQIAAARQKLAEILGPLQVQEIQERLKQMQNPKTELVGTPGGGTSSISISPEGVVGAPKEVIPGRKGLKERLEDEQDPKKKAELLSQFREENEAIAGAKMTPVTRLQKEAAEAYAEGDMQTYQAKLKEASDLSATGRAQKSPNKIDLIMRANAGDKEAQQALESLRKMDVEEAMARGEGWGKGRAAYQFSPYVDNSGQIVAWNNLEAMKRQQAGETLIPASRISPKDITAFQQFNAEATPALKIVRDNAAAFDNPTDRLIYANVLSHAGTPAYGQEVGWLRNVIRQAVAGGLSPVGRQEAMGIARLNETVGRMRSILGLPATDNAMALTLSLVPGPGSPDSKYVVGYDDPVTKQHIPGQVDMLEQMAQLAVGIPAMRGVVPGGGGSTPPPGAKIMDLDDFLKQH